MTNQEWNGKRRRAGRPQVPTAKKRRPFCIRISPEELERVEAIRPEHVPMGKMLRDIIVRASSQPD